MKQMKPHLCFFHKESTDVAPLKFKSAMCLCILCWYKATLTVNAERKEILQAEGIN
jgi:hypothetical protein